MPVRPETLTRETSPQAGRPDWTREEVDSILATLKSVGTGRIEISLRENQVVGVVRRPFGARSPDRPASRRF